MAKQFYQKVADELVSWDDPQNLTTQADIQARIDALTPFQGLADGARELLAQGGVPGAGIAGGWPDLASFDDYLNDEIERLQDIADYYDYQVKQETIGNVADGAWWAFESVEAVSDESIGAAALAIDAENSTGWETNVLPCSITLRLRDYRKNVESIRIWCPNNTQKTFLNGVTVRAAQALNMIDDPSNVVASGVSVAHDGQAWQEVPFDFKKRCRYVKLDITDSQHASNVLLRNIEARVTTFNHEK